MNLLQVVHQFLPEYVGGTEVYVADLAQRLRARGHAVTVFAGASEPGRYEHEGTPVQTVSGGLRGSRRPADNWSEDAVGQVSNLSEQDTIRLHRVPGRTSGGPVRTFLRTFGNREAESAFLDLLARSRPDLVHFHHLLGLSTRLVALARERGLPTCFTLHDYWFTCPKSQLIDHRGEVCGGPRAGVNCAQCAADRIGHPAAVLTAPLFVLRERRVKRAIGAADLILAPSRFMAGMAVRHGLPAEKVRCLPFGIDRVPSGGAGFHPAQTGWKPVPPGSGDPPLRVTYLGGIDHSKGVHVLTEAARLVGRQTVRVRVYGDLSADPAYAAGLATGPAELMGLAARAAVPGIFSQTDVLVVPSLWYENSPMVIAEAHAAGVPVIASDLGALPERVEHGVTGLRVPPGDAQALAAALSRLAGDRDLLHRLRENLTRQEQPSRAAHIDQMEQIYRELTGGAVSPLPLGEG